LRHAPSPRNIPLTPEYPSHRTPPRRTWSRTLLYILLCKTCTHCTVPRVENFRLHYSVTNVDVWEADLNELRNIKSYNDGYSITLLVIIDVLSKYAWIEPLRNKTSNCIIKALQRVFSRSEGWVPVYMQTDKSKEFIARPMQEFLKESDIRFQVTRNPDIKAAIVERFNRTLKEQMWCYFTYKNTWRYMFCRISCVLTIIRDIRPPECSRRLWREKTHASRVKIWLVDKIITWSRNAVKKLNIMSVITFASIEQKAPSRKDTRRSGARQYFEFIAFSNSENLSCTNWDLVGEVIHDIFYEKELARVEKNLQEEEFIVDRVIKRRDEVIINSYSNVIIQASSILGFQLRV